MKRYKVTGTGKVMVRKPGKQHINEKKRPNRLSRLGKTMQVPSINLAFPNKKSLHTCGAGVVILCMLRHAQRLSEGGVARGSPSRWYQLRCSLSVGNG